MLQRNMRSTANPSSPRLTSDTKMSSTSMNIRPSHSILPSPSLAAISSAATMVVKELAIASRRVEDDDEDRRVDDQEDLGSLTDPEPDHGHGDHGHGRDEAQELRVRLQDLAERPE